MEHKVQARPSKGTERRHCCGGHRPPTSGAQFERRHPTKSGRCIMRTFFSFLIVLVLLVVPTYIVLYHPQYHNALAQVLFDLLLFAASLWFAVNISTREAEKEATSRWLPAAETACNELLTMIATIATMRSKHVNACESVGKIFPNVPAEQLEPVVYFMKTRCGECAANLGSIRNHVENSFRNWEVFIVNNCEESQCEHIHSRLEKTKSELGLSTQGNSVEATSQDTVS